MLLLAHRLGALGDFTPLCLALGYFSDPIAPPGCSSSVGPDSPSWSAPVSHGKAQPPFLPRSSRPGASEPHLPLCPSPVPPLPPGEPAQPQPGGSHPLWLSPSREERGLQGWMGLSEGSPQCLVGHRRGRGAGAVHRARSRFHGPCRGICLPASKATHGL